MASEAATGRALVYAETATEAEFQAAVVDLARLHGWRVHFLPDWVWRLVVSAMRRHPRRGREWSAAGFPDLVLVKPPRVVFAELKSARGRVRPVQAGWLDDLGQSGVTVCVWRPKDLEDIEVMLSGEGER